MNPDTEKENRDATFPEPRTHSADPDGEPVRPVQDGSKDDAAPREEVNESVEEEAEDDDRFQATDN
jgi:hypothetical protein